MRRHWKKLVIGLGVLVVLVLGGSFVYAKLINKADPALSQNDVNSRLDATTTTVAGADPVATDPSAPAGGGSVDGTWTIATNSEVGYRVNETINGFKTTANGRTQAITGTFVIAGAKATTGDWTVDMTTFHSDESRRDGAVGEPGVFRLRAKFFLFVCCCYSHFFKHIFTSVRYLPNQLSCFDKYSFRFS